MARLVIGNSEGIAQGMAALARALSPDPSDEARALHLRSGARNSPAQAAQREPGRD